MLASRLGVGLGAEICGNGGAGCKIATKNGPIHVSGRPGAGAGRLGGRSRSRAAPYPLAGGNVGFFTAGRPSPVRVLYIGTVSV